MTQLAFRLNRPGPLELAARVTAGTLRAARDWRHGREGFESANGWTVRLADTSGMAARCIARAPDGLPEWWAYDAFTCMERAEGTGA